MWSKGADDFKIRHGITCRSCYFPESVSYKAMGRSILSLHYILLLESNHKILLNFLALLRSAQYKLFILLYFSITSEKYKYVSSEWLDVYILMERIVNML